MLPTSRLSRYAGACVMNPSATWEKKPSKISTYSKNILYFFTQGQDLYKSKQVRDKQIVRILGKVCLFSTFPVCQFFLDC